MPRASPKILREMPPTISSRVRNKDRSGDRGQLASKSMGFRHGGGGSGAIVTMTRARDPCPCQDSSRSKENNTTRSYLWCRAIEPAGITIAEDADTSPRRAPEPPSTTEWFRLDTC